MASLRLIAALSFSFLLAAAAEAATLDAVLDCKAETTPPSRYLFTVKDTAVTTAGQGGDPYNINKAKFLEWKEKNDKNSIVFADRNAGLFLLISTDAKPNEETAVLMGPILSTDSRKPVSFGCKIAKGNLKVS